MENKGLISPDKLSPEPRLGSPVNVARYGKRWVKTGELGLMWDDPRDIYAVVLCFESPSETTTKEGVKLQYWQKSWPNFGTGKGSVWSGWEPIDDFFNGRWKDANFKIDAQVDRWLLTFEPVSTEFPELVGLDVSFRRTLKIRVVFTDVHPELKDIEVYTTSTWRRTEVSIEWGSGGAEEAVWDGCVEVFNGELADLKPLKNLSKTRITSEQSWTSKVRKGETEGIRVSIWYAHRADEDSFDETVVTIRSKAHSFSFSMDAVDIGERIFIRDYDVLVSRSSDGVELRTYEKELANAGMVTVYDLVNRMPEQTLERAWRELPPKSGDIHFIMGCKGRRQKFGIDDRGVVFFPKLWNVKVKGKCSHRFLWEGDAIAYSFGLPPTKAEERHLMRGFLPIVYAKWVEDGVVYEQESFVTTLFKDLLRDLIDESSIDGDDPVVCMVKVTITSQSLARKTLRLELSSVCKARWEDREGTREPLECVDGFVFAGRVGEPTPLRLRYYLDSNGKGEVKRPSSSEVTERLFYEIVLEPGESHTIYVKIPPITLTEEAELNKLSGMDFELEREKVVRYWLELVSRGSEITVPNEWLNDFYRAHLTHVYITDDKEPGSQRYICRVSSFNYGFYPNESAMVISELDRRGLHEEAERRLEVYAHYQGTAVMSGMYSSSEGVFFGGGGYECGRGYGQHHGWSLWVLAEHYRYSRNKEWLSRMAPHMVKGCDWIIKERRSSKGEYIGRGFLPPGGLEDVTDFWHWVVTNAHAYRGLKSTAEVLSEIGHPDTQRLAEEAERFREDLIAGLKEATTRSPVVRLRDGTWVPHFPSRLERRGRDVGWIRETLEGAINLILCGLIDPESKEAEWILKDYEDNLYISEEYGYALPDLDRYWFSRGGFSRQPNLYGFQIPYLWRGEVKHYLRALFNSFAVTFYPNTRMLTEHPLPTMSDWGGDHFKTSDESMFCYCLRLALLYERGKDLLLLYVAPREWFDDGKRISVREASTYFGKISFETESKVSDGFMRLRLNPPTRDPPERIIVRLRHPEGLEIAEVRVNGEGWKDFDREKSLVFLRHLEGETEVIVHF